MISRRFLIAEHEEAIYVTHTQRPRFVGIIYDADEAPVSGVTFSIGDAVVVDIDWIDPPVFDSEELLTALREALLSDD